MEKKLNGAALNRIRAIVIESVYDTMKAKEEMGVGLNEEYARKHLETARLNLKELPLDSSEEEKEQIKKNIASFENEVMEYEAERKIYGELAELFLKVALEPKF